jgi:hypothetical protein
MDRRGCGVSDGWAARTVIVSSWWVIDGQVWPNGQHKPRGYHCNACGRRGHNRRTCPRPE